MLEVTSDIITQLSTVLPTYYELTLTKAPQFPCITYRETNNAIEKTSDIMGYSYIYYAIKIWANDIHNIEEYAKQVDNKMRLLGYQRTSTQELSIGNEIERVLNYRGLAREYYSNT